MVENDIYKQVRRADFNKTESETLRQLVNNAISIGDEIKGDYVRLRQLTDNILEIMKRKNLLMSKQFEPNELDFYSSKTASASDGSFQSVGGLDGNWYVPISAALITFQNGITDTPRLRIGADIRKIDERQHVNLGTVMENLMLYSETTILKDWARDCPKGIMHFIDGPVIDPPHFTEKEYLDYRTEAINACLGKDVTLLGCVKKLLGNFLMECMETMLHDFENERLEQFNSDAYMIYHVFSKFSLQTGKTVYTTPLEISEKNSLYKSYKEKGLDIYFMYFQQDPRSKPFRVDIPLRHGTKVDPEKFGEKIATILRAWSYPGYDLPIPIIIAHDKCNIRKGCAEVLYSEIITRAASDNQFDNLVRTKLGMEVM